MRFIPPGSEAVFAGCRALLEILPRFHERTLGPQLDIREVMLSPIFNTGLRGHHPCHLDNLCSTSTEGEELIRKSRLLDTNSDK